MSQEDFYDHYEITVCLQKTSMTTMRQQFFTRRLLWPLCDNSTSQENFYDQYEKTVWSQEDFNDHYETTVCIKKTSMTTMRQQYFTRRLLWPLWDNSMSQEDFYDHYETIVCLKKTSMTTMRQQYSHKNISMTTMRQQYVSRRPLWPL